MKVTLEPSEVKDNDEVIIRYYEMTQEITQIVNFVKTNANSSLVTGYIDSKIHQINSKEILYFEAVDNKVFFHTLKQSFEVKQKLYEVETNLNVYGFLRVSKAFIINLKMLDHLSPAFNGRFEATLINQEKIIISRQYVNNLKKVLGM